MPGLNLISGPGDQQTPTDSFVSNFLKGVQLPGQLQSQKLQNQMLQQHMDFQAQLQPLQMQKAQVDLQQSQAMNPVQIELLKSHVRENDAVVKHYQATEDQFKASDAMEQQKIDIARATAAAQVTAANTDNWVKLATLPGAVAENHAKVDLMHAEVGQTQAHTAALTAGIGLQGRQQDLAERQFAQQALTQSMSTLASLSTNYGPAMGQKYASYDPVLNHIFNSTNPVPPIQPQTAQGVLNQRLAPMLANAPAETIAEYGDLALKGTTAAQQFSGNMLGMGQNAGQSGLIQGSKVADNARANASAAAQSIYSLKTSRPGSGESSPPPGTVAPGQAGTSANSAEDASIVRDTKAGAMFAPLDYHLSQHGAAASSLTNENNSKTRALQARAPIGPSPTGRYYADGEDAVFLSSGQNKALGIKGTTRIPLEDAKVLDTLSSKTHQDATQAQAMRFRALVNAAFKSELTGDKSMDVINEFQKRYTAGALSDSQRADLEVLKRQLSE
jgi:hypothetical protein